MQIHFICSFGWFSPLKKVVPNIFLFGANFSYFVIVYEKKPKNLEKYVFNFNFFFHCKMWVFHQESTIFVKLKKLKKEKTLVGTIWSQFLMDNLES